MRLYRYIGPKQIADRATSMPAGTLIRSAADVVRWVRESAQRPGPDGFALACEFRRCLGCGSLTLVKGGVFECGVCGADLPAAYNVQESRHAEPGAAADGGA